jgi:hypothetical protein
MGQECQAQPQKVHLWDPVGYVGFIISESGIEANPEKISSITSMGPI